MLRGGPRGAMEALFELQAEEASALRAETRAHLAELRGLQAEVMEVVKLRSAADHRIDEFIFELGRYNTEIKELLRQRISVDEEILGAESERKAMFLRLTEVAAKAESIPARVEEVINSADVTQLHKRLADALEIDIWSRLARHTDDESRRLAEVASRTEKSVHTAVSQLRDANAGKPALPSIIANGPIKDRLISFARYLYARLLRLSTDLRDPAAVIAWTCVSIAGLSVAATEIYRNFFAR